MKRVTVGHHKSATEEVIIRFKQPVAELVIAHPPGFPILTEELELGPRPVPTKMKINQARRVRRPRRQGTRGRGGIKPLIKAELARRGPLDRADLQLVLDVAKPIPYGEKSAGWGLRELEDKGEIEFTADGRYQLVAPRRTA